MKIDPQKLSRRERYLFMGTVVVPRPIALVSTVSASGLPNLAPYSLFNIICYHPPLVFFTPMRRKGVSKKDTLVNIEETREYVINVVTEEIARQMNVTSEDYPPEVDEFKAAGLTPVQSDLVQAPRVAESPLNLECRLTQILEFGQPEITGEMVIGEVLRVHIRDDLYRDGAVDAAGLKAVGRMGMGLYIRTGDLWEIPPSESGEYFVRKE